MATNKGIPVINNFDLYAQKPLDSRVVIENEQELGELVNKGAIYDGMIFYRKDAQKFFQAQYLESGLTFTEFGGSSGGNVSPILFLFDLDNGEPRTTITEQEKQNLDNKLYSQAMYYDLNSGPVAFYTPSKILYISREIVFTQFISNADNTISSLGVYTLTIGEKNTINEYPITIESVGILNLKGTQTIEAYMTGSQIQQGGKLITDISEMELKTPFVLDIYNDVNKTKKEVSVLMTTDASYEQSGVKNKRFWAPVLYYGFVNLYLTIQKDTATNSYVFNAFDNPILEPNDTSTDKILKSKNRGYEWVDMPSSTYYNHFIYLALETTTNGTATIRINFTNTSNELINTLDKLKTALGQTFTLGGNGSIVNGSTYGTTYMLNQTSITGVVNGAQQVFNFADGTLTITDSVKQA